MFKKLIFFCRKCLQCWRLWCVCLRPTVTPKRKLTKAAKRSLISVKCAAKGTENCCTWRNIRVSTQESGRLNVIYAKRNLHSAAFWRLICACILERNRSSAKFAMRDLRNAATSGSILGHTPVWNPTNVMCVAKNLQETGSLNIILVFTAEWNHTNVRYAINSFHMVVISVDIPVSTEL